MQFRLWHLCMGIALCALACGAFVLWRDGFVRQHEARRHFESKQAMFVTVPSEPRWLEPLVGKEIYYRVREINLFENTGPLTRLAELSSVEFLVLSDDCTDDDLAIMASLPNVSILFLHSPRVTSAGIKSLRHHPNITDLRLESTGIDDRALEVIGTLMRLDNLEIEATAVTDAGLEHLVGLNNLRSLDASQTSISDHGLVYLGKLKSLAELDISHTRVTGTGLRALRSPPLVELYMTECPLVPEAIHAINDLPSLERVAVNDTPLPDIMLLFLRKNRLKDLHISGSEGVALEVRGRLPGVRVSAGWNR